VTILNDNDPRTIVSHAAASGTAVCRAAELDWKKERNTFRRIREASFDDYEAVAALQKRNGLTPRTCAGWMALWDGNPAYCPGMPLGWVIETCSGDIGGYIGNLPLEYRFEGRDVRAFTPYSWAADPAFRGYSLALLDRFVRQPGMNLIVCATANAAAGKVYRAFHFEPVPSGRWDKSGFWITGYRGFSRSALRSARVPLGRLLAYPAAAALFALDTFRGTRTSRKTGDLELCSGFDSRFDLFWDELQNQNPAKLLAVRTRATLAWHFRASLERGDAWIVTASKADRLLAYAILDRQDNSPLDLRRIRFVDFQALDGCDSLLRPTLERMVEYFRRAGAHVIENTGCWLEQRGAVAPYTRAMKSWAFYYKACDPNLARRLQDPRVWAPSSFDGDASI
jgi:hypothetical protein